MSGRKSSHEAKIGRHGVSYCTETRASMARTGSVEATRTPGGGISTRVEGTMTGVTGGKIFSRNGGIFGSP